MRWTTNEDFACRCGDISPERANTRIIGDDKEYAALNEKLSLFDTARENYDMLTLVIIRFGDKIFHEIEDKGKNDMMEFLHAVMYPHREDFLDTIKKHIDFSDNEELWKEVGHMSGLGLSIREECLEEGRIEGRAEGIIESGYDFGLSEQAIIARLQKKLQITLEQAEGYMEMFGKQPV